MNVVDSSGWLEYFAAGPTAEFFAGAVEATDQLIVPTVTVYEVFKRIYQQRGENDALLAIAVMQQGEVVPLTGSLAIEAARLSVATGLPMADSMILSTARASEATLWTQDADFEGMAGVKYIRRPER